MKTFLIFLMASCPISAHSQQVMMVGLADCGLWKEARSVNRAMALEHFLTGLLNGMSIGSGIEFWHASNRPITREQANFWMDKFCTEHPLDDLYTGATQLMNERSNGLYGKRPLPK